MVAQDEFNARISVGTQPGTHGGGIIQDLSLIHIFFCGSKKSLATGIPMMNVIFAGAPIGLLVIPIMVFHQLQLMVCSFLARKWAKDVGKGEQL